MVSFGLFGIVSAFLVLFLGETLHKPLSDEIPEVLQRKNREKSPDEKNKKNDEGSFFLDANQDNANQDVAKPNSGDANMGDPTKRKHPIKIK
jgi:hypothetical protein